MRKSPGMKTVMETITEPVMETVMETVIEIPSNTSTPSTMERVMRTTMKIEAVADTEFQLASTDWKWVLELWSKALTYDELKEQILSFEITPLRMTVYTEMQPSQKVDNVASNFFPDDGPKNMYPIQTYGDGNCFPRAISKLVFGDKSGHEEICARIIISSVKNENLFTSDDILSWGEKNIRRNSVSVQYVMYSGIDSQSTGRVLPTKVREIYQRELLNLKKARDIHGHMAVSSVCRGTAKANMFCLPSRNKSYCEKRLESCDTPTETK